MGYVNRTWAMDVSSLFGFRDIVSRSQWFGAGSRAFRTGVIRDSFLALQTEG
ncbi:hypothetical protein SERLA73DRAFT_187762 [Serpula lacrymans var. lacrymans S7.3]|uniref:Uncharacterized protein n=2 Tax=Serpula lacrymans var. lacrymans TaxID=341189 RepID=F8QAB4_SERL3|nr:uncharacterized protein SERLADRAFT_477548 [Serpula lacrymans var. lacrymans S7.9]EGN94704.1 hypothetical protein SERLA73DRAFT_187762 [Serpula lacrymans var. lacrymans S7.3]EGO20182.1 hypothetical protein SERLADRAFT_477548 [Serpula lacrymans var. lacrymans S7.9]